MILLLYYILHVRYTVQHETYAQSNFGGEGVVNLIVQSTETIGKSEKFFGRWSIRQS